MNDVKCPYCGEGVNICHDDGVGCGDGELHHQWCKHCEKTFACVTTISYSYDVTPALCIDDENVPHQYNQWGWCDCGERDPKYKKGDL